MAKTDARIRYTKKVIKDAFLSELKEKPINKITVKDICDIAEINRATFYSHYENVYNLLEQLENELFQEVTSTASTANQIENLYTIIKKNKELCEILFSDNGDKLFLLRLLNSSRESSIKNLKQEYPHASESQLNYLYEFSSSGAAAVIAQWVNSGMQEQPQNLEKVLEKLQTIWFEN